MHNMYYKKQITCSIKLCGLVNYRNIAGKCRITSNVKYHNRRQNVIKSPVDKCYI